MATAVRLIIGVGLFSLGYFMGREIGRLESLREEMRRLRDAVDRTGVLSSAQGPVPPDVET